MRAIILLTFLAISLANFAQQEPQLTIFWNNFSLFNPAYTGLNYKHYGAISYRNQWTGFNGNPTTLTANYNLKLDSFPLAFGVGYSHDEIGFFKSDKAQLNLSFIKRIKIGKISVGASSVYNQMVVDGTQWITATPDPSLTYTKETQGKVYFNFGAFLKTKKLEVGISSTQLNEPLYDKLGYKSRRHYFLLLAYNFKLSEAFNLKSSLLAKTDAVASAIDVNNRLIYKNKYWMGATVRPGSGVAAIAGIKLFKNYNITYAYEIQTGTFSQFAGSTHEIALSLTLE